MATILVTNPPSGSTVAPGSMIHADGVGDADIQVTVDGRTVREFAEPPLDLRVRAAWPSGAAITIVDVDGRISILTVS